MTIIIIIFLFILGAIVGSFLNVYIYRVCKNEIENTKETVFRPKRSYCPACGKQIAWYDNIPLVSYLILLQGRCRSCRTIISFRYFSGELICAVLTVLLYYFFVIIHNSVPQFLISLLLGYALLAVTCIDFKVMIIPDEIFIGVLISFIYPNLQENIFTNINPHFNALYSSLTGVLVGGGVLILFGLIGEFLFKKEAMGGGDVKLLAMVGGFLGYKSVFFVVFLASLLGSIFSLSAILLKKKNRRDYIPFGPFLAMASLIVLCFKKELIQMFFGY